MPWTTSLHALGRRLLLSPAIWFWGLALVVAGPLLGSGYLLLLDFPSGPEFPTFSWFPLPSSGDIGNTTPLLALERGLRAVHPYLPDKVLLLAPIVLGGVGIYRFVTQRLGVGVLPAIYGGTLFVVNPFVLDRYLAGHVHFLLAFGLLPWAVLPLEEATRVPSGRCVATCGLWLGVIGAIDIRIAGIYGVVLIVALLSAPVSRRIGYAAMSAVVGVLLSAYWIMPAFFAPPGAEIGSGDLEVYASRPEGYGVLPSLAGMYGFWRQEFVGPAQRIPALALLLIPILGLALLGIKRLWETKERRRFTLVLGASAGVFLLLAGGTSFPPTAGVFRWLFENLVLFRVYREPQKLLAIVVLAYALFGAVGFASIRPRRRDSRVALTAGALLVVLAYSYTMLWGFWGQVGLSRYPESWAQANRVMQERGEGTLLVFPWNLYAYWGLSGSRVVANPAPSFFSGEVLTDKETGFLNVGEQSSDPFTLYMRRLLEQRYEVHMLGHLLAPLGVRYIARVHAFNDREYEFVDLQPDVEEIYSSPEISIYENRAWRGEQFGLEQGETVDDPARIFGSDFEARASTTLIGSTPLRTASATSFPPVAKHLTLWGKVSPPGTPFLLTTQRCTDGWVFGDTPARCHLGSVAAFDASGTEERLLWRPAAGARLVGLVVSSLTLLGIGLYLWRGSRPSDREAP